ncbi:sulfotransferase family 2 domain-containing protein [Roseibacillus persicicus]|uniref:sulfotransferase family 2 domain-containing protein n=1 Tax=Roseibacillus persicicus TaxID=454148 RepID=UPI00398B47B8
MKKNESALAAKAKGFYRLREQFVIPQARHIVSHEHRLILGISPKSGCTVASKLFFGHLGLLEEALKLDPWIHRYRIGYRKNNRVSLKNLSSPDYFSFKVVRSPYTRAVSSYTHTMRTKISKVALLKYLGYSSKDEVSFYDFMRFLSSIDMRQANRHYGLQALMQEGKAFTYDYVLKLEALEEGLAEIETRFGKKFSIEKKVKGSVHHTDKGKSAGDCVAKTPFGSLPKKTDGSLLQPPYADFYDPTARELVETVYRRDFELYDYCFDL